MAGIDLVKDWKRIRKMSTITVMALLKRWLHAKDTNGYRKISCTLKFGPTIQILFLETLSNKNRGIALQVNYRFNKIWSYPTSRAGEIPELAWYTVAKTYKKKRPITRYSPTKYIETFDLVGQPTNFFIDMYIRIWDRFFSWRPVNPKDPKDDT